MFNVAVVEDGHYRLRFEALGRGVKPVPTDALVLTERGSTVAIQVDDGGDGVFGRGDSLRFIGRRLAGAHSWHNQYSRYNVYQLQLNAAQPNPAAERAVPQITRGPVFEHLEQDLLRVALTHKPRPGQPDHWYWQRITHIADDSFKLRIRWKGKPQAMDIGLSGLTLDENASAAGLPQHHIQIRLDGAVVGNHSWDAQDATRVRLSDFAPGIAPGSDSLLEISVPARRTLDGQGIVDAVLLDWLEVEYAEPELPPAAIPDRAGARRQLVARDWLHPAWVAPLRNAAKLAVHDQQADYLMITHASLREALEPLANYHRDQGLSVRVVDVQSIYDDFTYGIASPLAIRVFIRHAWENWRAPAPRFVLLAGDASWTRDSRIPGNRNLVPTMQSYGEGGAAASDNGLVSIAGDDWRPDLAVGRLPAATPDELSTMVSKILRYAQATAPGDWRDLTTWISDSDTAFQTISDDLALQMEQRGFNTQRIYPQAAPLESDKQQRIIEAFNRGTSLVHFLGHGGRFVWRTGPMDLQNASDLFASRDIGQLKRHAALPLVLSMTCSSGPFDHPQADSMAESLMGAADRGAIGVVAASRRVPPSKPFSARLLAALFEDDARIGEALMRAKQQESRRSLVESYNLFGDPAMQLGASK